jgi:biopolymer transport protein ExbD
VARKRRGREGDEPEVPVQSFADIAFLLIIFFILATSFTQLMGVETDMPSGKKAEAKSEKTNIVNIHNGAITFNDKGVSMTELRKRLDGLGLKTRKGEDRIVMLEATGRATYQQYYQVVTAISASGGVIAIVEEEQE